MRREAQGRLGRSISSLARLLLMGLVALASRPSEAVGANYYVFDARGYYFYIHAPPPPLETLKNNYDTLVFLTSLQGVVNRTDARFYLYHHDVDEKWLSIFNARGTWPSPATATPLSSLDQVISAFKTGYGIQGSVVWDGNKPFTLALAATVAGADNLVIVRKDSPLYSQLVSHFPVRLDLSALNFSSKNAGYTWLSTNYLSTRRVNPTLAYFKDGWPMKLYLGGKVFDSMPQTPGGTPVEVREGWSIMMYDYAISKRVTLFDLAPHPTSLPRDEPAQPVGADYNTLVSLMGTARQLVGTSRMLEFWGFPNRKYMDCNPRDGAADEAEFTVCAEWATIELLSQKGGVLRKGGGDAFGVEFANASFYQHGPATKHFGQNPPLSPQQLLQRGYATGFPNNFSFEQDTSGTGWALNTTNRVIYTEPLNAKQGSRFLQVNVSSADLTTRNAIHQDFNLALWRGYRYSFRLGAKWRKVTATSGKGRQVVWGFRADGSAALLCQNAYTLSVAESWQTLSCDFDVKEDVFKSVRLQVFLDTPNENFAFDEAYFLGPNTLQGSTSKQYALFYMGDYDFANVLYSFPTGTYPFVWLEGKQRTNVPVAWGVSPSIREEFPSLLEYFFTTKTAHDYFVMPDSGSGYLNPGFLPDPTYTDIWKRETANANRALNYRSGWVLNGRNWPAVGDLASAEGQRIRHIYKTAAPDGIFYNAPSTAGTLDEQLPVLGMPDVSYAGKDLTAATNDLLTRLSQGHQFNVFRNIFVSSDYISDMVARARASRGFEVLDPYTFFSLAKLKNGIHSRMKLGVTDHTIPSTVTPGQTYTVRVRVRNEGWDLWSTPLPGSTDCDGSGTAYKGCYRVGLALQEGDITPTGPNAPPLPSYSIRADLPTTLAPGESVDLPFTFTVPAKAATYTLQFDLVKELYSWGESVGNVPWQKKIVAR